MAELKRLFLILPVIFAVTLVAAYFLSKPAPNLEIHQDVLSTTCLDQAFHVQVSLKTQVEQVQIPGLEVKPELAVENQLQFLKNSILKTNPEITHFSFSAAKKKIKVVSITQSNLSSSIDLKFDSSFLAPEQARSQWLVQKKNLEVGFPIDVIDYEVQAQAVLCSEAGFIPKLETILPKDPDLAFWDVPSAQWENLTYKEKTEQLNFCADSELADLPQPEAFWYFWDPSRRSKNGVPCLKTLESRLNKLTVSLTVNAESPKSAAAATFNPQSALLILGWTNTQYDASHEYEQLLLALKSELGNKSSAPNSWKEPRSKELLEIIGSVISQNPGATYQLVAQKPSLEVQFQLKDKKSLRIFWGPTDALGAVTPRHYQVLQQGLRADDLIVYAGHAALGKSFLPPIQSRPNGKTKAQQLVVFLSCYSFTYLKPEDLFSYTNSVRLSLITTASSTTASSSVGWRLISRLWDSSVEDFSLLSPEKTFTDDHYVVSEISSQRAAL